MIQNYSNMENENIDSFDEVMKRNNFDLENLRVLFNETCKDAGIDGSIIVDKGVKSLLLSVGIVGKTYWDVVKSKIKVINEREGDSALAFLMEFAMILSWEKIEKQELSNKEAIKERVKMVLN